MLILASATALSSIGAKVALKNNDLVFSQGQKTWAKTFGGVKDDKGLDVKQTSDGGYIVTGITWSYSQGNRDVWLIKVDEDGNETWNRSFGGKKWDWGGKVQQTSDGGYIIAGFTQSYGAGWEDCWLIKTDPKGNEVWNKTFGGSYMDYFYSVKQTPDNGYIAAGFTTSFGSGGFDGWLIKTDDQGNELWNRTFGWEGDDLFKSVDQTPDGGYILSGETTFYIPPYNQAVWLVKTDSNGTIEWDKTYLDTKFKFLRATCEIQRMSDGYIIAGYGEQYDSDSEDMDFFLLKTDLDGEMKWCKTFGRSSDDKAWEAYQTTDGGCIMAGHTKSYIQTTDNVWLIKTNKNGKKQWSRIIGGNHDDFALSVQQTSDGGYIVAGATMSYGNGVYDVWLIKTDSEGRYIQNSQNSQQSSQQSLNNQNIQGSQFLQQMKNTRTGSGALKRGVFRVV